MVATDRSAGSTSDHDEGSTSNAASGEQLVEPNLPKDAVTEHATHEAAEEHLSRTESPHASASSSKRDFWRSSWIHGTSYLRCVATDTWWPETLALAFSSICLVAIAVLLRCFDHKRIPQLGSGLTLNTIVAILAAASKSSLIYAVAGAMGQSKWCSFASKPKRLQDLQNMDDAARGPLGSVTMLFSWTTMSLCFVGAVIVIIALGFDSFIQQVVSYPLRDVGVTSSAALTRQAVALQNLHGSASMFGDVYAGIFSDSFDRTPICPSGNCTWPVFRSAGWCSKCEDVSSKLGFKNCDFSVKDSLSSLLNNTKTCTLQPPEGRSVQIGFEALPITNFFSNGEGATTSYVLTLQYTPIWLLSDSDSEIIEGYVSGENVFLEHKNPLIALGFAYIPGLGTTGGLFPSADPVSSQIRMLECVLTPCARTYDVSVTEGNITTDVLDEDYGVLYWDEDLDNSLCWRPAGVELKDINLKPVGSNDQLRVDSIHFAWCSVYDNWVPLILSPFNGTYNISMYEYQGEVVASLSPDTVFLEAIYQDGGLHIVFPGITAALTRGALYATTVNGNEAVNFLNGTIHTEQAIVVVRWEWLILPLVLEALAIAFLAVTMFMTRRHRLPIWKSSAVALLYHGLQAGMIDCDESYELASAMDDVARETRVTLGRPVGEERRMLLTRTQETPVPEKVVKQQSRWNLFKTSGSDDPGPGSA